MAYHRHSCIQKIPLPMSGVMLAISSLANILSRYGVAIQTCLDVIALALMLLILIKLIRYTHLFVRDMQSPILASVAATFSMTVMNLAVWIQNLGASGLDAVIWSAGLLLHVCFILYYAFALLRHLTPDRVFGSQFVVFSGILTASITCRKFNAAGLGRAIFYGGFAVSCILLVYVIYCHLLPRTFEDHEKPLICGFATPASLCMAGYVGAFKTLSYPFAFGIFAVACVLYFFALTKALHYLCFVRLPFFVSYASYTFPLVGNAVASVYFADVLIQHGHTAAPFVQVLGYAETAIGALLTAYVLTRFIGYVLSDEDALVQQGGHT